MNSLWKSSGFLSKKPLLPYHQLKIQTWWIREADTPFYSISCTRLTAQLSIIDAIGKVLLEASGCMMLVHFTSLGDPLSSMEELGAL